MDNNVLLIGLGVLAVAIIVIAAVVYSLMSQSPVSSGFGVKEQPLKKNKMDNTALSLSKSAIKGQSNKRDPYHNLTKKLRCAGWNMLPVTFRAMQLSAGFGVAFIFFVFGFGIKILWLPFGFATGLVIVNSFLRRAVMKRFKNFDNDYPNFLLSLCGLMRTGMNPMHAIEVATEQLNDQSLLKFEVHLMLERLKFGVSEDLAIGAFGESIDHPEIELFVQAFLLSRRLGGTLSDTLERMAKTVRKRQFFRASAMAAVSLQRGSVWAIMGILMGLITYILIVYPALILEGFNTPMGQAAWQIGIMMMMFGVWWIRQVTNIKV